ncbi:MAG: FHA domain-containing protein [Candidatus Sumerlaeaceae bacterium]|nr:FHA domain-containing protein [Candidatus Sumerlaeaceae bacterium]
MARLLLITNGTVREVQLGQELTIGRAYSNLLRLEGEEISRVHAIIYRRGAEYVVRDLDSKNGVILNGQKVVTSLLNPGDEMMIGEFHMCFDPPDDFDSTDFLRRHSVKPDADMVADNGKEMETLIGRVKKEPKTDKAPAVRKSKKPPPEQIFFSVEEVETMVTSRHPEADSVLLEDFLQFHRSIVREMQEEDVDADSALCQHLLNCAVAVVGADRGIIILRDESSDTLRHSAITPPDKEVAVNRVVLRATLQDKQAVMCNDAMNDDRFLKTKTVTKERIGGLMAFPLMKGDDAVGLIYVDVIERKDVFRRDQLIPLHIIARLLDLFLSRPVLRH